MNYDTISLRLSAAAAALAAASREWSRGAPAEAMDLARRVYRHYRRLAFRAVRA